MTPETLRALLAAREDKRAVVLATRLSDGLQAILGGEVSVAEGGLDGMGALDEAAGRALADEASGVVAVAGEDWFLNVRVPAYRLVVIGAVHIAQALVPLARHLAFDVTVVDPRAPFNTAERFGDCTRLVAWPDEALAGLRLDARTAVVALTHDPKLDDPALDAALRSAATYIGALGSRRSQAGRLERLAALGHGAEALARVRGPVGLALGAVSAPEIALSIVAEIVAVRRGAAIALRG